MRAHQFIQKENKQKRKLGGFDVQQVNIGSVQNESSADLNTAVAVARELQQNMEDLDHIQHSGSTIAAGNPHNVQSLKRDIVALHKDLIKLGFNYNPSKPNLVSPRKRRVECSNKMCQFQEVNSEIDTPVREIKKNTKKSAKLKSFFKSPKS